MNYEQFLEQMKEDLQARFAEDLPPELADVRIGIRDVEKLQGESYRGISFRSGDSPVEANLNMTGAFLRPMKRAVPMRTFWRRWKHSL